MRDSFASNIPEELIPYTLPNNWTWFLWSDIYKSYQQGMIRSNRELGEGNVYYLKMGDLNDNGIVNLTDLAITKATEKEIKEFELNEGDFLINVRNSKELVGKTCVIREIDKTILFNHMLVRIDNGSSEMNYFINAFLNIPSSKKLLNRIKQGTTTVIALYQRELNQLPIPLPDKLTFKTILSIYKSIDAKIELNNRINRELESMAKTLYDYWFVQFDFPDENSNPYKSSGGKMVWNEELNREIPEGWEVKKLSEYASIKKGTLITENTADTSGKFKVVSAGIDFSYYHSTPNYLENTITISASGANAGFINFWREPIFACDCTTVRGRNTADTLQILGFLKIRQEFLYKQARGSAQPHVYPKDIEGLTIPIPPKIIIEKFGEIVIPNNEQIANNLKQNQQLSELRDWLLPMLMNGQVSVKEDEEMMGKKIKEEHNQ